MARTRYLRPGFFPADLAMALELAMLIAEDNDDFFTVYDPVAEWLRFEVIAALRGQRGR